MRKGQYRDAEEHSRAALHIAGWELKDVQSSLRHRRRLALLLKNLGLLREACRELGKAIADADAGNEVREAGVLRKNAAIAHIKLGDYATAGRLLDEAAERLASSDDPLVTVRLALVRSNLRRLTGSAGPARETLESLLVQVRSLGYSREEAICLEYTGDCHLAMREYKKALEHYQAAQTIADATAPKGDLVPELGHRIGECLVHLGDANAAIIACERGLRVALDTSDRYEECATQRVLAMAHRAAGNPTKAFRIAQEGIELGRRYEIPYELARTLFWAGETRLQSSTEDERAQGRQHLWDARAVFERLDLKQWLRAIDALLGFEEQALEPEHEPGLTAIAGLEALDRGALRFGIVTVSSEVAEAVATIQSIAPSRIPVLITGPSGTGKELLARALHQMSDRRRKPFIPMNCAAIPAGLLDSELFGHERGAFTGAVASREGLFGSADTGTLFLDEVGELAPVAQATLLRILESGELRRVGTDEIKTIDVRVVAATNASLEDMVERGTFRRDLYYRLAGTSVSLPGLAEREDDIVVLFRYFFAEAVAASKKRVTVSPEVETFLRAYAWPGNVRELRNEVTRAVAMADDGAVLGREAFLPRVQSKSPTALRREREIGEQDAEERRSILHALRAHRGNKADAARSLGGMKRTTLIYKIERHQIRPEEYLASEDR
jgi:DNA-binding NtrC family response regulator